MDRRDDIKEQEIDFEMSVSKDEKTFLITINSDEVISMRDVIDGLSLMIEEYNEDPDDFFIKTNGITKGVLN